MDSSPTSNGNLPEGVSENDLYEGPAVAHLPSGAASFLPPDTAKPPDSPEPKAPATITTPAAYGPQHVQRLVQVSPVSPPPPAPVATTVVKSAYPDLIRVCLDVLATKVHTLLVLLVGAGIWGYATYDPQPFRILVGVAYSVLVVLPMLGIYWKTGTKGE